MPDFKDPKASGAIIREPEATGIPIESNDPTGEDIGGAPADLKTAGGPDQTDAAVARSVFLARRAKYRGSRAWRDDIDAERTGGNR